MIKFIFKPFIFIIKLINYITVNLVKFTNLITSFVLILTMIFVGVLYYVDKTFTGGYYASYLVQFIFTGSVDWFFRLSNLVENNTYVAFAAFIGSLLILFILKRGFKKALTTNKKRNNSFTNIMFLIINIFLNLVALIIICIFVLNLMVTRYVNFTTGKNLDLDSTGFLVKVDYLKEQIESDRQMSYIALNKIIFDINNDPYYFANMTMDNHIKICEEINHLIDIQGGPLTSDEHYLRNKLNYAPKSLDSMLLEIKNGNSLNWQLMPPKDSALHMFGNDGEYNIKFVSGNGNFEAVYDIYGELLDENNNPANMGTYNYADPTKEVKKHSVYDVAPYYIWGNTENSRPALKPDALRNLEKFYKNHDAEYRYEDIKAKCANPSLISSSNEKSRLMVPALFYKIISCDYFKI